MNCPRCNVGLTDTKYRGIEVAKCSTCKGIWLDQHGLDAVEDIEFDRDDEKGSLMFRSYRGDLHCPICLSDMQMFHYRAYDLELDFCPKDHGFWLDEGEEKRVRKLMKVREKDIRRSRRLESDWTKLLKRFKSKSFTDRIKDMFGG